MVRHALVDAVKFTAIFVGSIASFALLCAVTAWYSFILVKIAKMVNGKVGLKHGERTGLIAVFGVYFIGVALFSFIFALVASLFSSML